MSCGIHPSTINLPGESFDVVEMTTNATGCPVNTNLHVCFQAVRSLSRFASGHATSPYITPPHEPSLARSSWLSLEAAGEITPQCPQETTTERESAEGGSWRQHDSAELDSDYQQASRWSIIIEMSSNHFLIFNRERFSNPKSSSSESVGEPGDQAKYF